MVLMFLVVFCDVVVPFRSKVNLVKEYFNVIIILSLSRVDGISQLVAPPMTEIILCTHGVYGLGVILNKWIELRERSHFHGIYRKVYVVQIPSLKNRTTRAASDATPRLEAR